MSRNFLHLLLAFMVIFFYGCSGGASNSPVFPDGQDNGNPGLDPIVSQEPVKADPVAAEPIHYGDGSELRIPLAFCTFVANPATGTVEIESLRTAQKHLNGVPLLESPTPMIGISGIPQFSNGGKQLDVNVVINHPEVNPVFTVFDVHGVLMSKGTNADWDDYDLWTASPSETRLMNPDGSTRWWNPKEFTNYGLYGYAPGIMGGNIPQMEAATINGYKLFADGLGAMSTLSELDPENRAMFSAGTSITRHYTISLKSGLLFNYAVDASWAFPTANPPTPPGDFPMTANMAEPYWIEVDEWVNTLWFEQWEGYGGNVFYHITVHDWQGKNTIGSVKIEIPAIGVSELVWDLLEEGPNYKMYDFRVVLPELISNNDLDVLISVDSSEGSYQPAGTGVNKPLKAYSLFTTVVADQDPIYNSIPVCIMYNTTPSDILINQSVTFSAADSYDPDGEIIGYEWDFDGDGYYGELWDGGPPSSPTKTYHAFGNYVARCRIEDNNHAKVISAPIYVNVTSTGNLVPFAIAEATTDTDIMSDETVSFDASASYDIDGEISSYMWDFNGDGSYGDPFDSGTEVEPTVSWPAGEYDVQLKVIDDEAGFGILDEPIHVTVGNYPPVANAIATTTTDIWSGQSVDFDATASNDPDGTIDLYEWDFDGDAVYGDSWESGAVETPTKVFPDPGEFDVDLRITDNLGAEDTLNLKIHVSVTNPLPTADAYAVTSTDILKNETVEFDATGSSDPNGTVDQYLWDFNGDLVYGDLYDSGTPENPVKAFTTAGNFEVGLKVVDNNGGEDILDTTIPVNVTNNPPTAAGGFEVSPPYYINTYYDLNASASSDPDGTIVAWEWDINYDGSFDPTLFGEEVEVFWATEGEYSIMLRVEDDDGGEDFFDTPLDVEILYTDNAPPVFDYIEMSRTTTLKGSAAEAITMTCHGHDPNVGDSLTYEWSSDLGEFDVTDEQTVVWTSPNQVVETTVTCRVYDSFYAWDEGDSDTIFVTQWPTAALLPDIAPAAYYWSNERLWDTTHVELATYSPGKVVEMNFWQTT